jgi:hypothetical protein
MEVGHRKQFGFPLGYPFLPVFAPLPIRCASRDRHFPKFFGTGILKEKALV